MRETTEAVVGAVTSPLASPRSLLLGRYDDRGRLQYTGRTTTLAQTASSTLAGLLAPARPGHSWTGWSFSVGWGSSQTLTVTLVRPELVVEVHRRRPRCRRPVAPPRTPAPPPYRPLPRRPSRLAAALTVLWRGGHLSVEVQGTGV